MSIVFSLIGILILVIMLSIFLTIKGKDGDMAENMVMLIYLITMIQIIVSNILISFMGLAIVFVVGVSLYLLCNKYERQKRIGRRMVIGSFITGIFIIIVNMF